MGIDTKERSLEEKEQLSVALAFSDVLLNHFWLGKPTRSSQRIGHTLALDGSFRLGQNPGSGATSGQDG